MQDYSKIQSGINTGISPVSIGVKNHKQFRQKALIKFFSKNRERNSNFLNMPKCV